MERSPAYRMLRFRSLSHWNLISGVFVPIHYDFPKNVRQNHVDCDSLAFDHTKDQENSYCAVFAILIWF